MVRFRTRGDTNDSLRSVDVWNKVMKESCIQDLLTNIWAELMHIWFSATFTRIHTSTHYTVSLCLFGGCECPKGGMWETSRTDRPDPGSAVGESRRMSRIRRSIHHLMLHCCWITMGREKAFYSQPPSWPATAHTYFSRLLWVLDVWNDVAVRLQRAFDYISVRYY